MEYEDHVRALTNDHPALAREVGGLRGLRGVMSWMKGRALSLGEVTIHQQDEFSLDFVVPLSSTSSLVFGIT